MTQHTTHTTEKITGSCAETRNRIRVLLTDDRGMSTIEYATVPVLHLDRLLYSCQFQPIVPAPGRGNNQQTASVFRSRSCPSPPGAGADRGRARPPQPRGETRVIFGVDLGQTLLRRLQVGLFGVGKSDNGNGLGESRVRGH